MSATSWCGMRAFLNSASITCGNPGTKQGEGSQRASRAAGSAPRAASASAPPDSREEPLPIPMGGAHLQILARQRPRFVPLVGAPHGGRRLWGVALHRVRPGHCSLSGTRTGGGLATWPKAAWRADLRRCNADTPQRWCGRALLIRALLAGSQRAKHFERSGRGARLRASPLRVASSDVLGAARQVKLGGGAHLPRVQVRKNSVVILVRKQGPCLNSRRIACRDSGTSRLGAEVVGRTVVRT